MDKSQSAIVDRQQTPLKKSSLLVVVLLTVITGGIYMPIWFLTRRQSFNSLHSSEKLGKGVFIFAIIGLLISTIISLYSGFFQGLDMARSGELNMPVTALDLLATNALMLIVFIPLVSQTFKVKRILHDHFNTHLRKDIQFSKLMTLLFLNFYLQHKINRLDK